MANNDSNIKFAKAISDLDKSRNLLDSNSYIEISRNDKSYKTTLKSIGDAVIDKFPLYNNLNDTFNSLEHLDETYFKKEISFGKNPYVHDENVKDFSSTLNNQLITRSIADEYLNNSGICVPVCTPSSKYHYYDIDQQIWIQDNSKIPLIMASDIDGIWTSNSKVKFKYGANRYFCTDSVKIDKRAMLDVIGNIVLNETYSEKWYESQNYFVALTIDGKIITLVFLKNILKLDDFTIAQFHFHCPLSKNATFKIITNAQCKLLGNSDKDQYIRKLYDSLNAVNLGYYA